MFDWIQDAVEELVVDTLSMAESVITLGDQGEFSKDQIARMVSNGVTLFAVAEFTGVAVDVIEDFMDEEDTS